MKPKTGSIQNSQKGDSRSVSLFLLQVVFALSIVFSIISFYSETGDITILLPLIVLTYFFILLGLQFFAKQLETRRKLSLSLIYVSWAAILAFVVPYNTPFLLVNYLLIFITTTNYIFRRFAPWGIVLLILASTASTLLSDTIDPPKATIVIAHYVTLICITILGIRITEEGRKKQAELVERSKNAQVQEERLHSLINSMQDAVIATDERGMIAEYNGAALNLININDDIKNKNISDVLAITDQEKNRIRIIEEAKAKNNYMTSRDYLLSQGEDEMINLYISVAPVSVSYGKNGQKGYIFLLRDITDEKSLEEERDEFISVVSHELRTPITITEAGISNAMIMYEKDVNNPKIKQTLEESHDQVVFLANMMNDLSTLSRAQRNNLNIDLATLNPIDIAKELYSQYKPQVEAKGLEFKLKVPDSMETIITSKLYLDEILQNFITNATKYTKEGSVTLSVENDKRGVRFSVTDTGIGISTSDQERLFDKFFRSEDYRTRETGGTGLGLYISLKLARRMNGKINFQSQLNKGSTFSITVPPVVSKDVDQRQMAEQEAKKIITEL